ncbi:MAG: ATP-dependent helicase [Candidatus Omnitrophica bacterium]|nr:ATP-dependent helicase [Candidatus Omnitrophota bacterium]
MSIFHDEYKKLNTEQREAVDKTEGPLLVIAGPGTGKTQLLSLRCANIFLEKKIHPENILLLTFTNAAAMAMRERLSKFMGEAAYSVQVETFHSFANSVVLESEEAISYIKSKIELSEVENARAMKYILDNVKGVEAMRPFGDPYIHTVEIAKKIGELRAEGITPEGLKCIIADIDATTIEIEDKHLKRLKSLAIIYDNYEKLKTERSELLFDERGRLDFDDMIFIANFALKDNPELLRATRAQYKYIMVDEFQDTNMAQLDLLLKVVCPESNNLCCVGDDDQSIYRFQGANTANFKLLRERFTSLSEINLKKNYRSSSSIVDLSNILITHIPQDERAAVKELSSAVNIVDGHIACFEHSTLEEELSNIVTNIKNQGKEKFNDIAILLRKRNQIGIVVEALIKAGIPYATDGKEDISGEKRVLEMLDILEFANLDLSGEEDKDLVLYKILSSDYLGIEPTDLVKFVLHLRQIKNKARYDNDIEGYKNINFYTYFFDVFDPNSSSDPKENETELLPFIKERKIEFKKPNALHKASWALHRVLYDAERRPVHEILMTYIEDVSLYAHILKTSDEEVLKLRDLRTLVSFVNMIKEDDTVFPGIGLKSFINNLELRKDQKMPLTGKLATLDQNGVKVITAHSSKGLEFDTVFVPFCLDRKSWPNQGKADVLPLPGFVMKTRQQGADENKKKILKLHDELRLFYVASTRAKRNLYYSYTPTDKNIVSPFVGYAGTSITQFKVEDEKNYLLEYLKKNITKDDLLYNVEELAEQVKGLVLTPTKLNTYIACHRKFFYNYVLCLPGRKKQQLVFGNCVHKALEEVYGKLMKEGTFPDFAFFKKVFFNELEFQGISDALKNWCSDKLNTLSAWYERESRKAVTPVSLEEDIDIWLSSGVRFKGKFDKVEKTSSGGFKVIDYKTGKPDKHIKNIDQKGPIDLSSHECDDYYRQLIAYKLVYEKHLSKKKSPGFVISGELQFVEPVSVDMKRRGIEKGDFHDIEVTFNENMVIELENVINNAWAKIQNLEFDKLIEKDEAERCRWCDYSSLCWPVK